MLVYENPTVRRNSMTQQTTSYDVEERKLRMSNVRDSLQAQRDAVMAERLRKAQAAAEIVKATKEARDKARAEQIRAEQAAKETQTAIARAEEQDQQDQQRDQQHQQDQEHEYEEKQQEQQEEQQQQQKKEDAGEPLPFVEDLQIQPPQQQQQQQQRGEGGIDTVMAAATGEGMDSDDDDDKEEDEDDEDAEFAVAKSADSANNAGVEVGVSGLVKRKTKVRFSSVEVRKYGMILGDNPSTKKGLPVTIGWKHYDCENHPVDQFEYMASKKRAQKSGAAKGTAKPRRYKEEKRREYLVGLNQYDQRDFMEVLMEMQQIKDSRLANAGAENRELLLNGDALAASGKALKSFAFDPFVLAGATTVKLVGDATLITTNTAINAGKATVDLSRNVILTTTGGVVNATKASADFTKNAALATADFSKNAALATADFSKAAVVLTAGGVFKASQATADFSVNAAKLTAGGVLKGTKATADFGVHAAKKTTGGILKGTKATADFGVTAAKVTTGGIIKGTKATGNAIKSIFTGIGEGLSQESSRNITSSAHGAHGGGGRRSYTPPPKDTTNNNRRSRTPPPGRVSNMMTKSMPPLAAVTTPEGRARYTADELNLMMSFNSDEFDVMTAATETSSLNATSTHSAM